MRIMAILGLGNATPIFSLAPTFGPFKPAGLLPTITEEDKVILSNVQKVVEFLTAGSSISRTSNQVLHLLYHDKSFLLDVISGILIHVLFLLLLFGGISRV